MEKTVLTSFQRILKLPVDFNDLLENELVVASDTILTCIEKENGQEVIYEWKQGMPNPLKLPTIKQYKEGIWNK